MGLGQNSRARLRSFEDELKGQFVLFQNVTNAKSLEENAGVFL